MTSTSSLPNKLWGHAAASALHELSRQPLEGFVHQLAVGSSKAMATSTDAVNAAAAAGAAAAEGAAAAFAHRTGRIRSFFLAFLTLLATWFLVLKSYYHMMVLLLASTTKTWRTTVWAVKAGLSYKRFAAQHRGEDRDSDAYIEALGQVHTRWAQELLEMCRANGGVYVKAGQFASSFGAVPREYRLLLAGLEDRAIPRPYPVVQAALERELAAHGGMSVFKDFDETATAAASLAQVHRAVLRSTGQSVAVKVQYPGLESAVASDLAVLKVFNAMAHFMFPDYKLGWLVDQLEKKLEVELDFRNELHNARRVTELLKNDKQAAVPEMHSDLCTRHLLIMEWIDGCKITDKDAIAAQQINPHSVGMQMVRLFGELTLLYGFMHGDPHAGNIMVRSRGKRSFWSWILRGTKQPFEVVLLDHGTYLEIPEVLREQLCQLWCSFALGDKALAAQLSSDIAGKRAARILPVLLTQTARCRAEELKVQRAAGIQGPGDMAALLQTAPRALVEVLRINTVVRSTTNHLGVTLGERRRVLTHYALKGLPKRKEKGDHINGRYRSLATRAYLVALMGAWEAGAAVRQLGVRSWSFLLSFWVDIL